MSAATAGLMSAATAGQRGKTYLVIDHSNKLGENYLSHIHISASLHSVVYTMGLHFIGFYQ
jgi:hypothetical protein|tara:strand:+ start:201 stop:383 length:183 start_codon:yes stop_codon:yes gene_type:complete